MANVPENPVYDAGIYQLEANDPVMGGVDGIDNAQAKGLANRTAFLKAAQDLVLAQAGLSPDNADPALLAQAVQSFVASHEALLDPHPQYTTEAEVGALVLASIANVIPVGAAIPFFGGTVHAGFLKANGAAVSRTAYAALFAEVGTTYGVGDGATTFNLPDSRGEFLRGWDDARGIDAGRTLGSSQSHLFAAHNHSISGHTGSVADYFGGSGAAYGIATNGNQGAGVWTSSVGGTETRPRNIAVQFLIKY